MVVNLTKWGLLNFRDNDVGIQEVTVNVRDLVKDRLGEFGKRFLQFIDNDPDMNETCRLEDPFLIYETESIHPKQNENDRTPLLLLFGNPAPHSVRQRMFFSYEKNNKEHRFWKVLAESGIFRLEEAVNDMNERNRLRKKKLIAVNYDSPFQIYLDVFFSMPSPASGEWSGVAGLKKLFRTDAFNRISGSEKERVEDLIRNRIGPRGIVLTFQKDAFEKIKLPGPPDYDYKKALTSGIESKCQINPQVKLYCLAPTRLMYNNFSTLKKLMEKQNGNQTL